jgi:glycerol kinase
VLFTVHQAMEKDVGTEMTSLRVDGGMTANGLLLQFQSDLLQGKV